MSLLDKSELPRPSPDISFSVKDLFSLKGKTAIVTGGGSGIGLAVSQAYAEAGANVVMIYNSSPSALDRAKETAEKYGTKVIAKKCNVGDYKDIHRVFDEITAEFPDWSILVANSGVQQNTPCLTMTPEEWQAIVDVNLNGVFYCAQKAAQHFKKDGVKGNIIVTASMSGVIVNTPQSQGCYNSCKAACIHLVKSLAVEFAEICRVNAVSPGYINTAAPPPECIPLKPIWQQRTPQGREAETGELKGLYLYLASNASTFTTGANHLIDGGYCCL